MAGAFVPTGEMMVERFDGTTLSLRMNVYVLAFGGIALVEVVSSFDIRLLPIGITQQLVTDIVAGLAAEGHTIARTDVVLPAFTRGA